MTRKSQNPANPDAHPTAPGGMSEKQLAAELIVDGWSKAEAENLTWPAKIKAVIKSRRDIELRMKDAFEHLPDTRLGETLTQIADSVSDVSNTEEPNLLLPPDPEPDDDDDFDALMADLEEVADDEPVEPTCAVCDAGEGATAHKDGSHRFIDSRYYDPDSEIGEPEDTDPEKIMADLEAVQAALYQARQARSEYVEEVAGSALFIGLPGVRDYIFDGHRGTGPSSAERWMDCTASLGASRTFLETLTPNQQAEFAGGNTAARQGTTAHAVAETQARVVLGEISPEEADLALMELAIHPVEGEDYDAEMEGYVAEYTDLVKSFVDDGREVLIEERVTATIPLLSATNGEEDVYDITGSLDLGVMPEAPKTRKNDKSRQRLVVVDLKYGEGIDVDVDRNPQIRIYALALLARVVEIYGGLPEWLTDVDYVIVQPRLGGIKTWTETIDDLLDWQETVLSIALTEALGGQRAGAKFSPSPSSCQWCPARGGCPALLDQRTEAASELFDVMIENDGDGFPETGTLSDVDLARFYTQVRGLTTLADELKAELQRRAYRGNVIPGYTLVNYQPPRHWIEDAEEKIKYEGALDGQYHDKVFTTKMVTPTQAEKLLGEAYAQVEALVVKPEKRPVIAPEGDRRSKWTGLPPESMFEIED